MHKHTERTNFHAKLTSAMLYMYKGKRARDRKQAQDIFHFIVFFYGQPNNSFEVLLCYAVF